MSHRKKCIASNKVVTSLSRHSCLEILAGNPSIRSQPKVFLRTLRSQGLVLCATGLPVRAKVTALKDVNLAKAVTASGEVNEV